MEKKNKKYIEKEELYKLYINEKKLPKECAKHFNCSATSIRNRLKEYGIKRISLSERKMGIRHIYLDINYITKLYLEDKKSIEEIAKIFNVGHTTIHRRLNEEGISTSLKGREQSEEHIANMVKNHKGMLGKHHSPETRLKFSKPLNKNPNWIDGRSFEPYPITFTKAFKLAIRQRDGFLCLKCGMREEDSLILFKRRLANHHIDYNKNNTFEQNCCALCTRCNSEVNINKSSWTKFFQSMLSERYGYKYSENGDIILNILKMEI